jgi:hypothetical protein
VNVVLPDPDPAGLPAPAALLKFLLVLTFVLHVVPMNLVLGGGLAAGFAAWRASLLRRAGRPDAAALYLGVARDLAAILPVSTAFAVTFGIAPLLFVQVLYGQLFYTSSVLMAWVWLSVVLLVMAGYYGYYGLSFQRERIERLGWLGVASGVAFVLVAFVFTLNMTLMLRPERFHALYAASELGLHVHLDEPTLWPRFTHFVVAAFAVTGLAIAGLGGIRARRDPTGGAFARSQGLNLFTAATVVQLGVGPWFLASLPDPVARAFLGGHAEDTALLAVAVLLALVALVVVRRSLTWGSAILLVTIAGMSVVRHRVRALALEAVFSPDTLPVRPQWGVFAVFVLCLLAGVALVAWMAWRLATARPAEAER